jgi:hypothetical protein
MHLRLVHDAEMPRWPRLKQLSPKKQVLNDIPIGRQGEVLKDRR